VIDEPQLRHLGSVCYWRYDDIAIVLKRDEPSIEQQVYIRSEKKAILPVKPLVVA
jgi:hypothetical protein